MRVGAQALDAALCEQRVQLHARALPWSLGASAAMGAVLVLVTWGAVPRGWSLGFAVAQAAALGLRAAIAAAHRRALAGERLAHPVAAVWLLRTRVAYAAHGAVWAMAAALLPQAVDPARIDLVVIVFAMVAGGALISSAYDLVAGACFALPAVAPLVVELLAADRTALSGLLLLLVAAAAMGALRARRVAREAAFLRLERLEDDHLLQQLLRSTAEGFWFIDNEGRSTDLNPAMARLLGRPPGQVVGHSIFEFFEGADLEILRREIAARRDDHARPCEIGITRPDGSRRHCIHHATPIHDTAGDCIGSVGIWTDITERRQAEDALQAFEVVVNSLTDLVSVVDQNKVYRIVNDAWCRAIGRPRSEVLGRSAAEVLPDGGDAGRARALAECIERREVRTARGPSRAPGLIGRTIETTYYPYDPQGEHAAGERRVVMVTRDVTARERDRAALEAGAEYLRRTLNATGDAIFASDAADPDLPVRFVNEQMLQMWGIPAETAPTLTPAQIMACAIPLFADPEAEVRRIAALIAGNLPDESRLVLRDGRVLLRRCIPAEAGGRTIRVWSFRDVSAEERARQLTGTAEAEQRAFLDAFPGAIGRLDERLVYTYANRRLAAVLGLNPEQMVGRSVDELLGPRRGAELRALADRVLAGEAVSYEHQHPAAGDHGPTDVSITLVLGVDPRSGQRAIYGFALDIGGRKRAEQALRESEAELRALLAAFPGYIAALDRDLAYTYVNERFAATVGRPAEDFIGRRVHEVLGSERGQGVERAVAEARRSGQPVTARALPPTADGRPLELEITHVAGPRQADGQQVSYSFGIDVTARRQAEEALKAALGEAERANRAKSQFLSQMSHELRTPLNAILGFGQLLASDARAPLAAHQQAWVREILRGAAHLLELINEILDLGRIEAGQLQLEPEALAVPALVGECLDLVRALAQASGVSLGTPAPGLAALQVAGDRTRLKQVLLNLLGNAIKYNRPGGTVQVDWRREDEMVRLSVRDTGRGMTRAEQARLFQPFERMHAANSGIEGTGIGLALSRRLVEAMGGTIGAVSDAGTGTEFWVRLPAAQARDLPEAAHRLTPPDAVAPPPAATQTVLYIEDNAVNVVLMEAMLERMSGVHLVCTGLPTEGLRLARQLKPALVLLDIQLPEMDGFEVLARLRADETTRHVPVIAVSANALPSDIDAALAAGFTAYLTKPLALEHLLTTVREALVEQGPAPAG